MRGRAGAALAAGVRGEEREAAPGLPRVPRGFGAARLGWAFGMLVRFPWPGKAERLMAPVARGEGAAPAAFSVVARQPARRGHPVPCAGRMLFGEAFQKMRPQVGIAELACVPTGFPSR